MIKIKNKKTGLVFEMLKSVYENNEKYVKDENLEVVKPKPTRKR